MSAAWECLSLVINERILDDESEKEQAMKNRGVAILTLGSFLVFSWSCYPSAVLVGEKGAFK